MSQCRVSVPCWQCGTLYICHWASNILFAQFYHTCIDLLLLICWLVEAKIELCQKSESKRGRETRRVNASLNLSYCASAKGIGVCVWRLRFCWCAAFQKRGLCMTLISAYCGTEKIRGANCPENTLSEDNLLFPRYILLFTNRPQQM